MEKLFGWMWENLLFLCTVFLLVFIPLYPKLPLLDVRNTWVYVRVEDFLVLFVLCFFFLFLIKKKVTLKTPLTIPIMAFWIIGGIATLHGIILIFPNLPNVFPNVAFLEYLRHLEYLSMFFVAYAGFKNKKFLLPVIITLAVTFLGVVFYGLGQKYLALPAFLTMNEEFAKGTPIQLSALSRLPSTFAGHYDLAAYLVFIIPIFASLVFGFKNLITKFSFLVMIGLGFIIMFLTVSRVSFFVLLVSLFIVLLFQKKRLALLMIPVLFALLFLLALIRPSSLFQRFGNTVKEVDVMVNGKTGEAVGNITYVPVKSLYGKKVKIQRIEDTDQLNKAIQGEFQEQLPATFSALPSYMYLPPETLVPLVKASNISTGENLPQGTGYINLTLSRVASRVGDFFYGVSPDVASTTSAEIVNFHGNFIIKKASAYDLSFTTRFQGEWPHAIAAFMRNIFIGSGYGSVSLAVDNNYFRMLGEIGLLGTAAFLGIFLALGIYIKKVWGNIDSKIAKSFIIGFIAGGIGLVLNATLIDVFEASKIAFLLWLLTGVVAGLLHLYQERPLQMYKELRKVAVSPWSIVVYLLIASILIFSPMLSNHFVGEDFNVLRAATDCGRGGVETCAAHVFYTPLTKEYFYLMYTVFWFNPGVYHSVSIALYAIVSVLVFFLSYRILKSTVLSALSSFLFLLMSGGSLFAFYIFSTGALFSAIFLLSSILMNSYFSQTKNKMYYVLSLTFVVVSMLFSELGVVVPFLTVVYEAARTESWDMRKILKNFYALLLFIPSLIFLFARVNLANILSWPFVMFNILVKSFGVVLFGPFFLSIGNTLEKLLNGNNIVSLILILLIITAFVLVYKSFENRLSKEDRNIIFLSVFFFVFSLLPLSFFPQNTFPPILVASFGIIILLVFLMKKLYGYLLRSGADIALTGVAVILLVFGLFHLIQIQQAMTDSYTAGERVKNFFVSIDSFYSDEWSRNDLTLHFVRVPLASGAAPVFSSGLENALWFSFENKNLHIVIDPDIQTARSEAGENLAHRIFEFQDDGKVVEVPRRTKIQ